jgi:hypothetical protein
MILVLVGQSNGQLTWHLADGAPEHAVMAMETLTAEIKKNLAAQGRPMVPVGEPASTPPEPRKRNVRETIVIGEPQ